MGIFLLIAFLALAFILFLPRMTKEEKQLGFIAVFTFHPVLKTKLQKKYPGLTDEQLEKVFQGLRDYFAICNKANGCMVTMPSRIVDEAWHEFILFSRDYEAFCGSAFGRFLHHTPTEAINTLTDRKNALTLAWNLGCKLANIESKNPLLLPLLFTIDEELAIPGGIQYEPNFDPSDYYESANDVGDADVPTCG